MGHKWQWNWLAVPWLSKANKKDLNFLGSFLPNVGAFSDLFDDLMTQ